MLMGFTSYEGSLVENDFPHRFRKDLLLTSLWNSKSKTTSNQIGLFIIRKVMRVLENFVSFIESNTESLL